MAENADEFGREIGFVFERRVNTSAKELPIVGEKRLLASVYPDVRPILCWGSSPTGSGTWLWRAWEDIASQETVGQLVGTRISHLIGY